MRPGSVARPVNGELFTLYVEKVLAQSLAEGEIMIFNNLRKPQGLEATWKASAGENIHSWRAFMQKA